MQLRRFTATSNRQISVYEMVFLAYLAEKKEIEI